MSSVVPKSRRACSGRPGERVPAVDADDVDTADVAGLHEAGADEAGGAGDEKSLGCAHGSGSYGISLGNLTSSSYAPAMTISAFVKHHFRHFNAATLVDAAEAWNTLLAGGGRMFLTMAGAMSHGRARALARRDDPAGEGPRHHLHGGEPRGGRLQPRGARPLRAHPALPRAEPRRGDARCTRGT